MKDISDAEVVGYKTAMKRSKPSAPSRWLVEHSLIKGRVLDYGCGRGLDADTYGWDKFDPHWVPDEPKGKYDTIVCNYVVNVVTPEVQEEVVAHIKSLLAPNGVAYITSRRDLPKEGRAGRGCFQRPAVVDGESVKHMKGSWEMYRVD